MLSQEMKSAQLQEGRLPDIREARLNIGSNTARLALLCAALALGLGDSALAQRGGRRAGSQPNGGGTGSTTSSTQPPRGSSPAELDALQRRRQELGYGRVHPGWWQGHVQSGMDEQAREGSSGGPIQQSYLHSSTQILTSGLPASPQTAVPETPSSLDEQIYGVRPSSLIFLREYSANSNAPKDSPAWQITALSSTATPAAPPTRTTAPTPTPPPPAKVIVEPSPPAHRVPPPTPAPRVTTEETVSPRIAPPPLATSTPSESPDPGVSWGQLALGAWLGTAVSWLLLKRNRKSEERKPTTT